MTNINTFLLSFLIFELVSFVNYSCAKKNGRIFRRLSCDEWTSDKLTAVTSYYEYNPKLGLMCMYHIKPHHKNVTQFRIWFSFTMMQPMQLNTNDLFVPKCSGDYVEIGGTRYCGHEDGQYLNFHLAPSLGITKLHIRTSLSPRLPAWRYSGRPSLNLHMKIEQLENGDDRLAPDGCTQYFTGESGVIKSFNYHNDHGIYPAGLDYTICIWRPPAAWGLKLKFWNFNLNGQSSYDERKLRPGQYCVDEGSSDHLSIPSSIVEPITPGSDLNGKDNKFCGRTLNSKTVISDSLGEFFLMRFESKSMLKNSTTNGFRVQYEVIYEEYLFDYAHN